jgi:CRISPR-associated protein Csx10
MLAHESNEGGSSWIKFVDALFGDEPTQNELAKKSDLMAPQRSRIKVGDARMSGGIRRVLAGSDPGQLALREALTFIKASNSIDIDSGRTKTDHLRFEEVARRGIPLQTTVDVNVDDIGEADRPLTTAFLVCAAALVDQLGGKRRRGLGECTWAAFGNVPSVAVATDALESSSIPPTAIVAPKRPSQPNPSAEAGSWKKYQLTLSLLSPLIIADQVQGNVITSHDAVPGTHLLQFVAGKLKPDKFDPWPHIMAGDIRVLPANPDVGGQRGLPVPLIWELPKAKGDKDRLRLVGDVHGPNDPPYKPVRTGFMSGGVEHLQWLPRTPKSMRTHNTVVDATQRPDEEVGGVYSYEAIAADHVMHAEVWVRASIPNSAGLANLLAGETSLVGCTG